MQLSIGVGVGIGMNAGLTGGTPNWLPAGATFGVNPKLQSYIINNSIVAPSAFETAYFTRSSTGTKANPNGVFDTFATNTMRRHSDGLLVHTGVQNKCENNNFNPTDLTGMVVSGNATATASVVDKSEFIAGTEIERLCTSGMVYEIDNTLGGSGDKEISINGAAGALAAFAMSAWVMTENGVSGQRIQFDVDGSSEFVSVGQFTQVSNLVTATNTGRTFKVVCPPGAKLWFILNQLQAGSTVTEPVLTNGAAATTAADNLIIPTADINMSASGGALFALNTWGAITAFNRVLEINDGTLANRINVERDNYTGDFVATMRSNSSVTGTTNKLSGFDDGLPHVQALRWSPSTGFAFFSDRGVLQLPGSTTMPVSLSQLHLGGGEGGNAFRKPNGLLKVAYGFDYAPTDDQMNAYIAQLMSMA